MRRAGARPRRQRGFISVPTKFPRTKAFPLGGRWPGEAGSDEGRSVKATASAKNPTLPQIKDFCQALSVTASPCHLSQSERQGGGCFNRP